MYRPSFAPGTDTSGYREQLLEMAPSIVAQEDAPVFKGLAKVDAKTYQVDSITDELEAPALQTSPLFDADPVYSVTDARARLKNYVQEIIKAFTVAEITDIISSKGQVAGVGDELAYGLQKKVRAIVRDIERTIMSEQTGRLDDDTNFALMDGFFKKVTNTGGANDLTTTTGNAFYAAITEDIFVDAVVALFDAGIEGELWAVAPSKFAVQASKYKGRVEVVRETQTRDSHKVDSKVEFYQAPVGGLITVHPNRSMGEGVALISKEYAKISELRGIFQKRTDTDQQHKRGFLNWYGTLVITNIAAHSGWKNDSTPDVAGE
jgi:hypothetical protein